MLFMSKDWLKRNKSSTICVGILSLFLVIGWGLYGLYGHRFVETIHEGNSSGFLNTIFQPQGSNPIEYYLEKADRYFAAINAFIVGLAILLIGILHKRTYMSLCLCLIFINIFLIIVTGISIDSVGGDYNIYCGAVKVFEDGNNPYLVDNLRVYTRSDLSFTYLPLNIIMFKGLCHFNRFFHPWIIYYICWSGLLLGSFLVIKKSDADCQHLLLFTLLITGFMGTYWNFFTGNTGLIHVFLISLMFYSIIKKKYYWASLFLVFASLLKIIPLIFSVLFIFAKISKWTKIKIWIFIALLFVLAHLLSFVLYPGITISYYLSIIGRMGQQHSPVHERVGTFFFLFEEISKTLFGGIPVISLCLYLVFTGLILTVVVKYSRAKNRSFLNVFSLGMLAFILIFPRFRSYSFAWSLVPAYFLVKDWNLNGKFLAVLVVSVAPLCSFGIFSISGWFKGWLETVEYGQSICLLAFFILILMPDYFTKAKHFFITKNQIGI